MKPYGKNYFFYLLFCFGFNLSSSAIAQPQNLFTEADRRIIADCRRLQQRYRSSFNAFIHRTRVYEGEARTAFQRSMGRYRRERMQGLNPQSPQDNMHSCPRGYFFGGDTAGVGGACFPNGSVIGPGIRPEMLEMLNGTHPSTSCRIHDLAAEFEVADTSQRRNPLIWSGTFEARYNSATNSFQIISTSRPRPTLLEYINHFAQPGSSSACGGILQDDGNNVVFRPIPSGTTRGVGGSADANNAPSTPAL